MSVWHIKGGRRLQGSLHVQGSKNAVLPIMAASLLTGCESELLNCPQLSDVEAAADILRHLGCTAQRREDALTIDTRAPHRCDIPRELMHRMRSSVIFLGPLLGRCGEAHVSVPGGCELGPRPIDLHLHALRCLGAQVEQEGDEIVCRTDGLRGAEIHLTLPSVGATENAMIAACAARGDTIIYNAAREPEIGALQDYLRQLGAEISGAGTPVIRITGFTPRKNAGVRIPGDRIAAATYLCCAAVSGGRIELRGAECGEMGLILKALRDMGCVLEQEGTCLHMSAPERLHSCGAVVTRPYPGFPTDASPLLMAASVAAEGSTVFVENIFESRYRHVPELRRMGADIRSNASVALVTGVERLHGAQLESPDLRGGAALVTAALGAQGESVLRDEGHIARGYEQLAERLCELGAELWTE